MHSPPELAAVEPIAMRLYVAIAAIIHTLCSPAVARRLQKKRAALQAPSRGRYGLVKIVFGVGLQSGAHSISYIVSQTPCPKHKSLYKQDSGRVFLHLHSRSIFRGAPKMPNAMMCLASLGDGGIADPSVYHFVHAVGRGPRRPALKKHAPPAWRVQGPRAVV